MNGLTKIRLINDLNEKELRMGVAGTPSSWHYQYRDSAWIYAGSLPYELSEGDVICVFSQYGEIVNINLIRDRKTGKSKGFAFVCYEDQKSTILAVDNLNGTKIKGRQIRVDHVMAYQVPKEEEDIDELTEKIREQGVAPDVMREYEKKEVEIVDEEVVLLTKKKKHKKEKKKKKAKLSFLKETPTEKAKKSSKTRDNITPPRKQKKEAKSERNNGRGEFNQSPRKTRDLSSDSDSSREKMKTKKAINRRKRRKDSESSVSSLDERNQRDNKRGERERPRDADSHEKNVAQEKHHRDADSTEKRHNKTYRDAVAYEKHHKMDSHEKRPRDNSHERNFDSTSRDKRQRDDYRHKTHESRQDKHKSYDRK
uniref:RRM domain-containing protein n=1 Tax=Ciona savignyi TaxID=51511 RepID=H2Y909_CIOSA